MSMLTLVQRFCRRQGLPVPSTVYGSTDDQVLQILALLEEEGTDLSGRGAWEGITFEATHTTLAQEDQGAITAIATNNYRYMVTDIWDRNLRLPVYVLGKQGWQSSKAANITGPRYQARIRGGKLIATPTPTAGHTWGFEYVSWNWILDNDGSTYKQYFTEDTDTMLLPEPILLQGLRWRWKREKGFDYAEEFRTYEEEVKRALGHDGMKKRLNMSEMPTGPTPGIYVPDGTWITP